MGRLRAFSISILGFLLLQSFNGHATITLIDVDGASSFTGIGSDAEDGDAAAIFGGTAGTACTNSDTTETCSNCASEAFTASCNDNRIYGNLELQIQFSSDSVSGTAAIGDSSGASIGVTLETATTQSAGGTHTLGVLWSNLCSNGLSIDSACESNSGSVTISVGVDGNSDGTLDDDEDDRTSISIKVIRDIDATVLSCSDSSLGTDDGMCNFQVSPGDEKVFLTLVDVPSNFPNGTEGTYEKLRFYFAEGSPDDSGDGQSIFSAINHSNEFFEVDVEVDDDNEVVTSTDKFAKDIVNGTEYYFRGATVDQAGNVGFHTPITASVGGNFHVRGTHSATPEPVFGLLSERFQCFIATAAYGSPFEPKVKTLRDFRDRFLNTSKWGRKFVETYYQLSPPLAQLIKDRPWLKKTTRAALLPFVSFADLSLQYGFLKILLLFSISLSIFLLIAFRFFRQPQRVLTKE